MRRLSRMVVCLLLLWVVTGVSLYGCGPAGQCRWDEDCSTGQLCVEGQCKSSSGNSVDAGKEGTTPDRGKSNIVCQDGHKRSCYEGPEGTAGVGVCKPGTQVCVSGAWEPCQSQSTPASKETCDNNLDDNCDGVIDDGCPCTEGDKRPCRGGRSGEKGPCRRGVQRCEGGKWSTTCVGAVTASPEICNGIDDDCNGTIDDGCPCTPGETQTCFDGPASALSQGKVQGSCQLGKMTCQADGVWGKCQGSVPPTREECNQKDDDCDGSIDEDCDCAPGETRVCFTGSTTNRGIGLCKDGKQTCETNGKWSGCVGEVKPTAEVCNGLDDDCDGKLDEELSGPLCGNQKGSCAGARRQCAGKKGWLPCDPGVYRANKPREYESKEQSCDGKDNDCDGQTDEELSRACYGGSSGCTKKGNQYTCKGTCKAGTQSCSNGSWGKCAGQVTSSREVCDGKDNDCNGSIDENGCQCTPGKRGTCYGGPAGTANRGECKEGTRVCDSAGKWGACQGAKTPKVEVCNGKDDDCDGKVDDGIVGPACSKSFGACAGTRKRCGGSKGWIDCSVDDYKKNNSKYEPTEKSCDGNDNDCDGQIDENLVQRCYPSSQGCTLVGNSYRCAGPCTTGTQRCLSGSWGACSGAVTPKTEKCNGKDDDCDGQIDNNLTAPPCSKAVGVCAGLKKTCKGTSGWEDCASSDYSKQTGYEAQESSCDGKDNDCDGQTDELLFRKCYSGQVGCTKSGSTFTCIGSCRSGQQTCSRGRWGSCQGEKKPTQENCTNLQDDDCNGKVDDCGVCTNGATQSCYPTSSSGCNKAGSSYACKGSCKQGTQTCVSNNWGPCVGAVLPTTEDCSNGKDDDCDGQVDECAQCQTGQTRPCYSGSSGCSIAGTNASCKGACRAGTELCVNGKWSGACAGEVGPGVEVCNWKDDDCDGRTDEGGVCYYSNWANVALSSNLNAVAFVDSERGVGVGQGGKAVRTLNGGSSWFSVTSGVSTALHSVAAIRQGLVLAVGEGGKILRSTNAGATFSAVASGVTVTLRAVHLFANKRAIAAGDNGTLLRSQDGGLTWAKVSSGTTNQLLAIAGKTTSRAAVVGAGGTILLTTTSGLTWTSQSSGVTEVLRSAAWDNATNVLAVGDRGVVVVSTNSGTTWAKVNSPTPASFKSVVSPGLNTFVLADGSRGFYLSTDNGSQFFRREFGNARVYSTLALRTPTSLLAFSPTAAGLGEGAVKFLKRGDFTTIRGISYNSSSSGASYAVGSSGTILRSTDRDKTWTPVYTNFAMTFYAVAGAGSNALAVGSGGAIYRSTDSGVSWAPVTSGTPYTLYGVTMSGLNAVAVGSRNTILRSTDGGKTWSKVTAPSPPLSSGTLSAVTSHSTTFVAVGSRGYILRSDNSGSSWTKVSSGVTVSLYGVILYPYSTRLVAVGSSGTALYSSDNGKVWGKATTGVTNSLYGVAMDWGQVLAVGSSGATLVSSDDGKTWTQKAPLSSSTLYAAYRRYGSSLYCAGGSFGLLLCSDDRARTWTSRKNAVVALRDVARLGPQNYMVVGQSGFAQETRDGGLTFLRQQLPLRTSFYGVAYEPSSKAIVMVGSSGTLLRRAGGTWSSVASGVTSLLSDVDNASANRFVAVGSGGVVLVSTNGGSSFRRVNSGVSGSLYKVSCNGNTCLASGSSGTLLRSTNGGDSWSKANQSLTTASLYSVFLNTANQAVAVGAKVILFSNNGGVTWQKAAAGVSATANYYSVFSRAKDQFLAGDVYGQMHLSGDGGKTWEKYAPPISSTLYGLVFLSNEGLMVGTSSTLLNIKSP